MVPQFVLFFSLLISLWVSTTSFVYLPHRLEASHSFGKDQRQSIRLHASKTNEDIIAVLTGSRTSSDEERVDALAALNSMRVFSNVLMEDDTNGIDTFNLVDNQISENTAAIHKYKFMKATGMLKLIDSYYSNKNENDEQRKVPTWIPVQAGEEKFLVSRGWSFLDPDESEPVSPFDVDAANEEGLYKPKWELYERDVHDHDVKLSSLGFSLIQPTYSEIEYFTNNLKEEAKKNLLFGGTDPPGIKLTQNGFDFSGPSGQQNLTQGIFFNPISNLPLFSTTHLSPTTASSGWLSFSKAIADDHVELIHPDKDSLDSRIEVVCAKTKCHLGHYFGKSDGYCINAGALNFIPYEKLTLEEKQKHLGAFINPSFITPPISWRPFDDFNHRGTSTEMLYSILIANSNIQTVTLGAGCFWHVEYALRRLPGVISTQVGYAGGDNEFSVLTGAPVPITYEKVCKGQTGFAEVVQMTFDTEICNPEVLFECFLALHDPTKVRAHGKHERKVGQYRSCIFALSENVTTVAKKVLNKCKDQLDKELCTDLELIHPDDKLWFWKAEDRHQLHDQRVKKDYETYTLSLKDWVKSFGRRSASIIGSSITQKYIDNYDDRSDSMTQIIKAYGDEYDDNDDGMARMMI